MADIVWSRLGDVATYNEPFAGSLAVLLERPHPPRIETVNDLDCVAPPTRILRADLTWSRADKITVGDRLIGFDEQNGEAREGLRAPKRYRRLNHATVTAVRILRKPCYRLSFDDGTSVVASENHLWLGGSHKSGGRGWRWVKTANMVCNRRTQRSWVLKVADVVSRDETYDAGWLGGLIDGEGHLHAGPGLRVVFSQNEGVVLDRAKRILDGFGYSGDTGGRRRCKTVQINGGIASTLSLLMRVRPERLIKKLSTRLQEISLYGRRHRAVGLVKKEFLGEQTVIAIETDCKTFIAEGLASHNCYLSNFWRALQHDPDGVAHYADWPVNEADLHARHRWLVETARVTAEKVMTDPDFYDTKIAGWWVWGQCLWIGSGWCQKPEWTGRVNGGRAARGILTEQYGRAGYGVDQKRRPQLSTANALLSQRTAATRGGENPHEQHNRPHVTDDRGVIGTNPANHNKRPKMRERGDDGVAYRRWQGGGAGGGSGVHSPSLSKQKPALNGDAGASGHGIHASAFDLKTVGLYAYMNELAARLRRVRVCCGDWKRVLTPSVTTYIGTCGVFLDPPYAHDLRERCYSEDHDISAEVREWALANGDNPEMRIALCGYEGEHQMPDSWECVPWKAHGGYSRSERGVANRARERIWFSPHCIKAQQPSLL